MRKAGQYAKRVNVVKYVKIQDKWRFAPVVQKNGKIVRDQVRVQGKAACHPEGSYYIEWRENGIRRRELTCPPSLVQS